jgi:hypothetical protein
VLSKLILFLDGLALLLSGRDVEVFCAVVVTIGVPFGWICAASEMIGVTKITPQSERSYLRWLPLRCSSARI